MSENSDYPDNDYKQIEHFKKTAKNPILISYIKEKFVRLDKSSAIKLLIILLSTTPDKVYVNHFKFNNKSFIRRNIGKIETDDNGSYIKPNYLLPIKQKINDLLPNIGKIVEVDEDDETKWSKNQINGKEVYEVNEHIMFQDIREMVDKEGSSCDFKFPFKTSKLKFDKYDNKMSLQLVEIYVNTNGESFGFPLSYLYQCPECNEVTERYEFEVCSTNKRIKCPGLIEKVKETGEVTYKKCNQVLNPDINRTGTKDAFIYGVTLIDHFNKEIKSDAISFIPLPKGPLKVVLQKIARPFGKELVFVVDYNPINKKYLNVPEKVDSEHYIFTLIKQIDKYIFDSTGYTHYGFLHVKMMMIIQFVCRYIKQFKNNINIALIGEMSSGKSAFSKYWGVTLYAESIWQSVATSISIPKLRGTMESFNLFDKDYRYQAKGLLGEVDLLVIDELKESPDVKNNLKQYLLEANYDYSKQGSNNQTFVRTAQALITENVDTTHLDKYAKEIKKLYQDNNFTIVNNTEPEPKPAWDSDWDLTLPLYNYDNRYLKRAVKTIRDEYTRSQKNWIDGSELALKQRFFFYVFLGSEKSCKELKDTIKKNSVNDIISDNIDLVRILSSKKLQDYFLTKTGLFNGTNDLDYFEKVDLLLKKYHKRTDSRTAEMAYSVLKIIRIIDDRNYCTDKDLEILQFLLENIDNKIEVADTNNFIIKGPQQSSHVTSNEVTSNQLAGNEVTGNITGVFDYNEDF